MKRRAWAVKFAFWASASSSPETVGKKVTIHFQFYILIKIATRKVKEKQYQR